MIIGDAKRHKLVERQFVRDVKIEKLRACRCEFETLAHDLRPDEKPRRDLVNAQACILQVFERPELIERMQGFTHRIFSERIFFLDALRFHDAGNGRVLGEALLLDKQLQRRETSPARAHRKFPGFLAVAIEHRPHAQRL